MPGRRTHGYVGATAGGAWAGITAPEGLGSQLAGVLLGGVAGGAVGGMVPDWLEPASTPNHRDLAHSWLMLVAVSQTKFTGWQRHFHATAVAYEALAGDPQVTDGWRFWYQVLAWVCRFLAGFLAGLQAGYASHLTLDALTPFGLPLVAR